MLLHAGINTMFSQAWPAMFPTLDAFRDSLHVNLIAAVVVAALLLATTRGRLGHDPAPAVRASVLT